MAATTGTAPAADPPCGAAVRKGTLPVWARDGFHPPTQRISHVLGRSNAIVAILFGYPLQSPPAVGRSNKILWVSRVPVAPLASLRISAQRMRGARRLGEPVRRIVKGGPGPSIVDLPVAGCWRLSLAWSGHTDTLDLTYDRPSG